MLDPLSALGLAGNVVQFVDFGNKLFSHSIELYHSANGALTANQEIERAITDLRVMSDRFAQVPALAQTDDERALRMLSIDCRKLADQLLATLERLRIDINSRHKKMKSLKQTLVAMCKADEIENYQHRLSNLRSQILLRLVGLINDHQSRIDKSVNALLERHERHELHCEIRWKIRDWQY